MQHVYKNIKEYNPRIKCRVLVIFDKMIADMISKKNLTQSDWTLFTVRKLIISLVFITQWNCKVPKDARIS